MDRCMDEWIDAWMNGWDELRMHGWINRWTHECKGKI
jgi:hypothetical protein